MDNQKPRSNRLKPLAAAAAFSLLVPLAACEVTQTEKGAMPDVDVSVEAGKLPKYDVDPADIDVGMKEVTIKVPDVDVTMPSDPDYKAEDEEGKIDENEGGRSGG